MSFAANQAYWFLLDRASHPTIFPDLLTVMLTLSTLLLLLVYRVRKSQHNVFKKMGVSGPEPHWFWGNFREFIDFNKLSVDIIRQWTKEFGKTFGYYEGPQPILVTSDIDILEQVFVKQFKNFHGRKNIPLQPSDLEKDAGVHMFFARGNRWKRLRTIINPTFSTSKLKQTSPLVNGKVDVMLDKMENSAGSGKPLDMSKYFQGLTLDVIAGAAFGMEVDSQHDPQDPFLVACQKVFSHEARPFFIIGTLVPEIQKWMWKLLIAFAPIPFERLVKKLEKVIELRRNKQEYRKDLVQLMLDAEDSDDEDSDPSKWEMQMAAPSCEGEGDDEVFAKPGESVPFMQNGPPRLVRRLSQEEVKHQSVLFLVAGYETTSTALSYTAYLLAVHQDIQQKLQQEIDIYVQDQEPTYANVQKIQYLDMVLCEVLRMYPLASSVINRLCNQDSEVNGLHIPKGVVVQADVWSVHYDADLWPDPHTFDPERFTPENKKGRHPLAWMPFGAGPRNCIGLRFALMEAKIAVARILKKYSICSCEETEVPLQLSECATIAPKNGVKVKLVPRDGSCSPPPSPQPNPCHQS